MCKTLSSMPGTEKHSIYMSYYKHESFLHLFIGVHEIVKKEKYLLLMLVAEL